MSIQQPNALSAIDLEAEKKLVSQSQQGDQDAFSSLYSSYVQAIYRYCLLRVQDPIQAEDLTAEVFLKAVDSLPHYIQRGLPFGAWLFRIAHDRVIDYYRKIGRRPTSALTDDLISEEIDLDINLEIKEGYEQLYEAISHLTDEQQKVIQFRFMEDWSLEKTAAMMNKSVNAVKALQHRALQTLQRQILRMHRSE